MQHGQERPEKQSENRIVRKTFEKKSNKYYGITSKIEEFYEAVKESEDQKDDREVMERDEEKKEIWNEILRLIESKRQEYIINIYEAQQIVYGINFLIFHEHVKNVEAERLRYETVKLAIKFRISPLNFYPQSDIWHQEVSDDNPIDPSSRLKHIVNALKTCVSHLEAYAKPGKYIRK